MGVGVCVHVCVCVQCVCVCMCGVCVYACVCVCASVCVCMCSVCVYACVCVCVCMHVCVCVCVHVCVQCSQNKLKPVILSDQTELCLDMGQTIVLELYILERCTYLYEDLILGGHKHSN